MTEMLGHRLHIEGKLGGAEFTVESMDFPMDPLKTPFILSHSANLTLDVASPMLSRILWTPAGQGPGFLLYLHSICQDLLMHSHQCLLLLHWDCL